MKYSEFLKLRETMMLDSLNEGFMDGMSVGRFIKYFLVFAGGKGLWNLVKSGAQSAISHGIESHLQEKIDQDAKTIKKMIIDKLNFTKDPSTGEVMSNDEMIRRLDQEGEATYQAVIKKRYPDYDQKSKEEQNKIRNFIKGKVNTNRDEKIIRYMHRILKDESDKVLKSIKDKERLERDDRDALLLYWQSKMTMLEVELGIILNQAGYIEEKTLDRFYDQLSSNYKNQFGGDNDKEGYNTGKFIDKAMDFINP